MAKNKPVPCGMCGGSGKSRLVPFKTCQRCGGSGIDPYASRLRSRNSPAMRKATRHHV